MVSRVGDDVSLPCTNVVYPNCTSTTWIYSKTVSEVSIEEVTLGKIEVAKTKRAERLSLGSDCSLNVSDVRDEDAGIYFCRQFLTKGGPQHGGDAPVKLSVLINQTPIPSLVVSDSQTLILTMGVGVAVGAPVCVVAAVIIARRRRTKTQMTTDDRISLNAVNHSTPPTNEDTSQPADRITYASILHFNQNPPQRVDVQGEDAVTRRREPENTADPSSLYSTVN
ncbi:hypothetical protein J4Q44_G00322410 [Coregonus suidteri]|uniref:Ig-like domain-containing protein n=1 Tax=Coregonus suidteri TaxID=861788 RepID=A0AAN8KTS8_9TELE